MTKENPSNDLEKRLQAILSATHDLDGSFQQATEEIANGFEARTCTLHQAAAEEWLHLRGSVGLPENIIAVTQKIPFGKGMAGICAQRRQRVSVCDLQTDDSGVVRPGAKETKVAGAVVVPLLTEGKIKGTLGIGKSDDHEYSDEEIRLLERCGVVLMQAFHPERGSPGD
jgi:signal transduction protein with GAF and PtsI domain